MPNTSESVDLHQILQNELLELASPPGTLEERLASNKLGPQHEAAGRDMGKRILAAVEKLPPDQREVFLMRTEGDIPFKQIAKIQKTSINTALARMH